MHVKVNMNAKVDMKVNVKDGCSQGQCAVIIDGQYFFSFYSNSDY
jgi:hypothetical protein